MKLKRVTGYAILLILQLAQEKKITVSEIAKELSIEQSYTLKILKQLKLAGYVQSIAGSKGGFVLIKDPKNITLLDIMNIMEKTMKISHYLEADYSYKGVQEHTINRIYRNIQKAIEEEFASVTIQHLIDVQHQKVKKENKMLAKG